MLARAQDCRDARGEPVACPAAVSVVQTPPPTQSPEPEPERHTHRDRESGYVSFYPFLDIVDASHVGFRPDDSSSIPEVERGATFTGLPGNFDQAMGGVTFGFGFRPTPWLRLPDVSLSWGYGDFGGASVSLQGGAQALTGSIHDMWMLRAQIGGGVDVDLEPVRIFALAHVGIAGYFADVAVGGSTIGGLGHDTYSAASFEAGWTVGMEIELDPSIAYTIGYRHVHTGVEQNTVFFGTNIRF